MTQTREKKHTRKIFEKREIELKQRTKHFVYKGNPIERTTAINISIQININWSSNLIDFELLYNVIYLCL